VISSQILSKQVIKWKSTLLPSAMACVQTLWSVVTWRRLIWNAASGTCLTHNITATLTCSVSKPCYSLFDIYIQWQCVQIMDGTNCPDSSLDFIALMMEAVRTSETSLKFNATTRRYIPDDSKLQNFRQFVFSSVFKCACKRNNSKYVPTTTSSFT
jgi:hypothetical protein